MVSMNEIQEGGIRKEIALSNLVLNIGTESTSKGSLSGIVRLNVSSLELSNP